MGCSKNIAMAALILAGIAAMTLASGDERPRMPAARQALIRHERAVEAARREYLTKLMELDRTLIGELQQAKREAMAGGNLGQPDRIRRGGGEGAAGPETGGEWWFHRGPPRSDIRPVAAGVAARRVPGV
jgi:hypothetical protein